MSEPKGRNNRQRQQVNWISRRYPRAWTQADTLRWEQHDQWPDWCYLPLDRWYEIARDQWPGHRATPEGIVDFGRLAALGTWRVTQGIYRFDPDLYAALIDTPLTGDLPDELLYRLPSWGVYVETPGLTFDERPLLGVYAHLDHAAHDGHSELRLMLDSETDLRLLPVPIRLGHGSLLNAIQAMTAIAREKMEQHFPNQQECLIGKAEQDTQDARDLTPILSLLLYLCAEDADYERPPRLKTARPRALGKQRIAVIPENVGYWDVGARIGAALRTARDAALSDRDERPQSGDRNKPRPHWRRAHWHTFWSGPKDGERTARVHWLPPIAVNVDAHTPPLPTVIHPVKTVIHCSIEHSSG